MTADEHEHDSDYFDFAPAPPAETEGVERPEGEDDAALMEPVLDALAVSLDYRAALDGALDIWDRTSMAEVRAKSLAMTDLFIQLMEERLPGVFEFATPLDHAKRGSQVALRHPEGYGIIQSLIERGVIGDFRAPDICRFGFTPLYLRFVDVFDAVERIASVMESESFRDRRFAVRNPVT